MRKEIPMLITALSGLVVVVGEYFKFAHNINLLTTFNTWFQIAETIVYPVGLVSLTIVHLHHIQRKHANWVFSIMLLVLTYVYAISNLITGPAAGTPMNWVLNAFIAPASATLYGMIAFVITSAVFRTFGLRSREVSVLIVTTMIVVLGTAPIGGTIFAQWPHFSSWLEAVPGNAAYRAMILGMYLGAFGTAIRILIGVERAHIGGYAK